MCVARETNGDRGIFTRRSFFQGTLIGALVCYLLRPGSRPCAPRRISQAKQYDLLLKGGTGDRSVAGFVGLA